MRAGTSPFLLNSMLTELVEATGCACGSVGGGSLPRSPSELLLTFRDEVGAERGSLLSLSHHHHYS